MNRNNDRFRPTLPGFRQRAAPAPAPPAALAPAAPSPAFTHAVTSFAHPSQDANRPAPQVPIAQRPPMPGAWSGPDGLAPRAHCPAPPRASWRLEAIAGIAILLGFMISIVTTSSSGGSTSTINVSALLAGLLAVGLGGVALARRESVPTLELRNAKIIVAVAIICAGCLHIARGFGAFL